MTIEAARLARDPRLTSVAVGGMLARVPLTFWLSRKRRDDGKANGDSGSR